MDGLRVGVVHSNRTKAKREEAVRDFREGKTWILIVTELMARGLDFKGVEVVVNYGKFETTLLFPPLFSCLFVHRLPPNSSKLYPPNR